MIPYGRQSISGEDIQAVVEVLRSDWITQGPAIERFERGMAEYCGSACGVAVSSATAGLHLACLALGIGPGDRVWTSPNTFVASANCARYCGASVDFVDIDPATYNLCPLALEEKLHAARRAGTLPKLVIPVHFAGQSCDMAAIAGLAGDYGFQVVEDASHAIGAEYLDGKVGNCRYSDMAVFSFHPVKIITTGEGGMIMANDAGLAAKLRRLRTHGITRVPEEMQQADQGAWYYEQIELGYNYRITDIQAALGYSQLQRLDEFVGRRRELAAHYDRALQGLPLRIPQQGRFGVSAYHLYPIWLQPEQAQISRRELFDRLRAAGIGVNVHYIPVPRQPEYRKLGFHAGQFPNAERYYAGAVSLPLYPAMTEPQQAHIIQTLWTILG